MVYLATITVGTLLFTNAWTWKRLRQLVADRERENQSLRVRVEKIRSFEWHSGLLHLKRDESAQQSSAPERALSLFDDLLEAIQYLDARSDLYEEMYHDALAKVPDEDQLSLDHD